jgi:hypothetical protein
MYFSKTVLILEDNLKVLSKLLDKLYVLEGDQPYSLCPIIFTTQKQVEDYLNSSKSTSFDLCLLDRDTLDGSFHSLDIERFGPEKIVGISSVPEYNEELKKRGVKKVILKTLEDVDGFVDLVVKEVAKRIRDLPEN